MPFGILTIKNPNQMGQRKSVVMMKATFSVPQNMHFSICLQVWTNLATTLKSLKFANDNLCLKNQLLNNEMNAFKA